MKKLIKCFVMNLYIRGNVRIRIFLVACMTEVAGRCISGSASKKTDNQTSRDFPLPLSLTNSNETLSQFREKKTACLKNGKFLQQPL
jgi:hypothetical protein